MYLVAGLCASIAVAFVYFSAPEPFDGNSLVEAKEVRISSPSAGTSVSSNFRVSGYGRGFGDAGTIRIKTAAQTKTLFEDEVSFHPKTPGRSGSFAYTVDLPLSGISEFSGRRFLIEVWGSPFPGGRSSKDSVVVNAI